MDTRTWASKSHALVRYPACPVCGDPAQPRPGAVRLEQRRAVPTEGQRPPGHVARGDARDDMATW